MMNRTKGYVNDFLSGAAIAAGIIFMVSLIAVVGNWLNAFSNTSTLAEAASSEVVAPAMVKFRQSCFDRDGMVYSMEIDAVKTALYCRSINGLQGQVLAKTIINDEAAKNDQ